MRVAAKYSMDDVQGAIVRVVNSLPSASEIARLAFIAEFPGHFYKSAFKEVFVQACSTDRRPSGHDLQPLMAFPHLVALMMHYREGIIQPNQAIWNERASLQSPRGLSGFGGFGGFGAPAAAPSGFGAPSASASAFGQPSASTPAFGQSSASTPVFGQSSAAPRGFSGFGTSSARGSCEDNWLDEQIESLGLAPFLAVKV